jgi:hypothetical protein
MRFSLLLCHQNCQRIEEPFLLLELQSLLLCVLPETILEKTLPEAFPSAVVIIVLLPNLFY